MTSNVADVDPEDTPADSLIQLRFSDEEGTLSALNATEFADVLHGLVEFTSQMAAAGLFGTPVAPTVRVRPATPGSFVLQALLQWTHENQAVAASMGPIAAGALGLALRSAIRTVRGETVADFEHLDGGSVKVTWTDKTAVELPARVWERLNSARRPTKKTMRKLMAPLSDDVTQLEISSGPAQAGDELAAVVTLNRDDYRAAVAPDPEPGDETTTFEVEATLLSVDFRPGEKWRIETRDGTRRHSHTARMDDTDYQRRLDGGLALNKSDIFRLQIRELRTRTGGRSSRDWTIVKVMARRSVGEEGDDAALPSAS